MEGFPDLTPAQEQHADFMARYCDINATALSRAAFRIRLLSRHGRTPEQIAEDFERKAQHYREQAQSIRKDPAIAIYPEY